MLLEVLNSLDLVDQAREITRSLYSPDEALRGNGAHKGANDSAGLSTRATHQAIERERKRERFKLLKIASRSDKPGSNLTEQLQTAASKLITSRNLVLDLSRLEKEIWNGRLVTLSSSAGPSDMATIFKPLNCTVTQSKYVGRGAELWSVGTGHINAA